jgi:hypothetical protein
VLHRTKTVPQTGLAPYWGTSLGPITTQRAMQRQAMNGLESEKSL